jgi:predicted transcriptional regulator
MLLNNKAKLVITTLGATQLNTTAISKKANLPRTTVEYILRTLKKAGYADCKKSGQATIWNGTGKTTDRNDVSVIVGINNIIKEFKSAIYKNGLSVVVIESDKSMQISEKKNINNHFSSLNKKFHDKKCLLYILFHQKTVERIRHMNKTKKLKDSSVSALMNRGMSAFLLPDNFFDLDIHIAAIGNKVFLTDFSAEKSICLNNPLFAGFIKQFFDFMSINQKKANVGRILEEVLNNHSEITNSN